MLVIEEIENGFLVRIEQENPAWEREKPKQILELPPEKIWYCKDDVAVYSTLKEHFFDEE